MTLYVGDDWAEDHHDVHLMDESGERLAARRLPEGVAGVTALHALVAEHASGPGEVVIGIETDRGPWVSALVAAGYRVYAINPRSASRYRDRHHVGGAKSDAGDARLLADLVRTDRHNHREVAGDSDEAGAVRILARAHRQTNRLRNALREYFPGALEAFPELAHGDAVGVLSTAPGPREAARLSITQVRSALRRGGRQRKHRAARRRGPRRAVLPAARGAARGEQGVRGEHPCGRLPGCPGGPRRDHGHRHLGGRQPRARLPRATR